jgi:hypothetical protein
MKMCGKQCGGLQQCGTLYNSSDTIKIRNVFSEELSDEESAAELMYEKSFSNQKLKALPESASRNR